MHLDSLDSEKWIYEKIQQFLKIFPVPQLNPNNQRQQRLLEGYIKDSQVTLHPEMESLDEIITLPFTITDKANCLLVLNNFRDTPLNTINQPIILRALKPVLAMTRAPQFFTDAGESYFLNYILSPTTQGSTVNVSIVRSDLSVAYPKSNPTGYCVKSIYFARPYYDSNVFSMFHCMKINFRQFVAKTRPWNCQASFDLFLPVSLVLEYVLDFFSKVFVYEHRVPISGQLQHFPTKIDRINVLIFNFVSKDKPIRSHEAFRNWARTVVETRKLEILNVDGTFFDIFLLVNTIPLKTEIHNLAQPKHHVETIEIFQVLENQFVLTSFKTLPNFTTVTGASSNVNVKWSLPLYSDKADIINRMIYFINLCDKFYSLSRTFQAFEMDRLAHMYAHLWISVMKNYTIVDHNFYTGECVNGKHSATDKKDHVAIQMSSADFPKNMYIFSYSTQVQVGNLHFLSCGKRGVSSANFGELVNIFDNWVWLSMLATIICISTIFPQFFWKRMSLNVYLTFVLSPMKLLMEQGNPFSDLVINRNQLKCTTGLILLAGIVLSNGYKSTNIFKLIAPRKTITYQTLSELSMDNFTLYTRSIPVTFYLPQMRVKMQPKDHFVAVSGKNGKLVLQSEVVFMTNEAARVNEINQASGKYDGKGHQSPLKSRLHPELGLILDNVMQESKLHMDNASLNDVISFMSTQSDVLQQQEQNKLRALLVKCNKTALILPDYLCKQVAVNLTRKIHYLDVSVGSESFSNLDTTFRLQGYVPPHISKRIMGITSSGLWNKDAKLLTGRFSLDDKVVPVKAPSLSGNIVVVFTIWASGSIMGGACFLCEIVAKLCSVFHSFLVSRTHLKMASVR